MNLIFAKSLGKLEFYILDSKVISQQHKNNNTKHVCYSSRREAVFTSYLLATIHQ